MRVVEGRLVSRGVLFPGVQPLHANINLNTKGFQKKTRKAQKSSIPVYLQRRYLGNFNCSKNFFFRKMEGKL